MTQQIDQRLKNQEWVEGIATTQAYLRRILKDNGTHIQTNFTGEDERNIRKWLFRVLQDTMAMTDPIERVGRVTLTEFYPQEKVDPHSNPSVDPVLPVPLVEELAYDKDFVSGFRRLYQTQQEYVAGRGPNERYGRSMLQAAADIQRSTLDELLTEDERCYFWDKLFDVSAHPNQYLTLPRRIDVNGLSMTLLFVLVLVAVLAALFVFTV